MKQGIVKVSAILLVMSLVTLCQPLTAVTFYRSAIAPGSAADPAQSAPSAECLIYTGDRAFRKTAPCFLSKLVNPTGLVSSLKGECFTTVYKNALCAIAFVRTGNIPLAEGIFDFFRSKLTYPFPGFRQVWNPCSGQADNNSSYWEGDLAFLLLSLSYYKQQTGSYGRYQELAYALKTFLASRADSGDSIVAEGLANMFAALYGSLEPSDDDWTTWQTLSALYERFFSSRNYQFVADHLVRGLLVFGDLSGFGELNRFERTEIWQCDQTTKIRAYSGFSAEDFINVEISSQLLLAMRLWQSQLNEDPSLLRSELEKLRLRSQQASRCVGLPYLVRHPAQGGFAGDHSLPIVDPTVWLLFDDWRLNPFAPGQAHVGCPYGKFVVLTRTGQTLRFPRRFRAGIDPVGETFPQEINDGNHKQIVVEFQTSIDLSRYPLKLTIDTVARDPAFEVKVTLDDGNHCVDACDRSGTFAISNEAANLTLQPSCSQSPPSERSIYTYQLVLEGTRGYGVFDWLQLEIPERGEILWIVGNSDNGCAEFDNEGFVYSCQ